MACAPLIDVSKQMDGLMVSLTFRLAAVTCQCNEGHVRVLDSPIHRRRPAIDPPAALASLRRPALWFRLAWARQEEPHSLECLRIRGYAATERNEVLSLQVCLFQGK